MGKILFGMAGLMLLVVAIRSLRRGASGMILRALVLSAGIYLLIAGLLLICGGLGTPH